MPESKSPDTKAQSGSDGPKAALASMLAAGSLDMISNVGNFSSVERYIRGQGRVSADSSETTTGMRFWVYHAGLPEPYYKEKGGEIKLNGTLVTVESGVNVVDAVTRVRQGFKPEGIGHLHIGRK